MSPKQQFIKKRKFWPIGLLIFGCITILMTLGLINTIQSSEKSDYIVETNAFFAPFEFYEGREIVGIDVDIVQRVAKKLQKNIQIKNVEFDVIIDNVEAGRIADAGAAGLTITPARSAKVDFTIPYYNSVQYVLYNPENPPALQNDHFTWETLSGKILGSQTGGTGYLFADAEISEGVLAGTNTTLKGLESHQLAADAIFAHIIDYVIIDELAANFITQKNPNLKAAPLYYQGETPAEDYLVEESYAIAVNRNRPELLEAFNEILHEMTQKDADGFSEIDKLVIKYMGLSKE